MQKKAIELLIQEHWNKYKYSEGWNDQRVADVMTERFRQEQREANPGSEPDACVTVSVVRNLRKANRWLMHERRSPKVKAAAAKDVYTHLIEALVHINDRLADIEMRLQNIERFIQPMRVGSPTYEPQ
jgi:hypothetical protein